jgi:retinol dehydrogenase-12
MITEYILSPSVEMLTDHGYDLQFGTNVLGHFYFTTLVLPALLAATRWNSHVVNTSSDVHWLAGWTITRSGILQEKNACMVSL